MTEQDLQQYLIKQYPKEDEGCEWKEFKNLKNDFSGHEKDDVISYVSALANMDGGHLVVGVEDKTLKIEDLAKVGNMLNMMREEGIIVNETKGNISVWSLLKTKK